MCDVGCESIAACFRRFDGRHDDGRDLVALTHQVGELGLREDAGFDKEFEPIGGLVGFGLPPWSPSVLDDGELVDEIGPRFPAARSPVVRSDGRGRAKELPADHFARSRGRQRFGQLDDPQGERPGSGFHGVLVHSDDMVAGAVVSEHPTSTRLDVGSGMWEVRRIGGSARLHPTSDIEHPTSTRLDVGSGISAVRRFGVSARLHPKSAIPHPPSAWVRGARRRRRRSGRNALIREAILVTVPGREDNHRDPTHRKAMDGPPSGERAPSGLVCFRPATVQWGEC